MIALRRATLDDVAEIIPRTQAFNALEDIVVDRTALEHALRTLIADATLGVVFLVVADGAIVGHLVVTYGFDLEFAGRDAIITEFWIDEPARHRGIATRALELLDAPLREANVRALHLQVRPENPARRIYERAGFELAPRIAMTKRL